jgi:hypothetical protein
MISNFLCCIVDKEYKDFLSLYIIMVKYEGKMIYILPQTFIEHISILEKLLIIPEKDDIKHVKNYKAESKNWDKGKLPIIKTFKVTAIDIKEGIEKDINDIRKALNMISKKNFDTQKNIILKFVKIFIDDDESLVKISEFVFDIASSNRFYGDIYADLYVNFIEESSKFKDVLHNYLCIFKNTIDDIKSVDSGKDYDGYCKNMKENDKRRSIASFYTLLSNRNIINAIEIIDIIVYFQTKLFHLINFENFNVECEEITEILYIMITTSKCNDSLVNSIDWERIISNISNISKCKVVTYKSLSSRVIFKHLDILDYLHG